MGQWDQLEDRGFGAIDGDGDHDCDRSTTIEGQDSRIMHTHTLVDNKLLS